MVVAARSCGGGIYAAEGSVLSISGSTIAINRGTGYRYGNGGGLCFDGSTIEIKRSTITGNVAGGLAGGILAEASRLTITDSTIGANDSREGHASGGRGGGIVASGTIVISNSTMTGNQSHNLGGGGVFVSEGAMLAVNNSIMAGNFDDAESGRKADDVSGTITMSNGHNVFGTDVTGNIAGDRENVAAGTVFAAIDRATGGGKLDPRGIVPLKKNLLSNPALSAADPIIASNTGQLGTTKRPQLARSLPDIGAAEADQPLSKRPTVNNDVLTGSAAANNLSGLAGNDYLQGLAGKDVLNGQNGSDVLDGGPGNDVLNGGTGMDIATFAGSTAVTVDLAAKPATAKRGGEIDTLTSIEGIIGSSKADTFKGDAANNEF
ncbi:MAG: right-handed parallel beta-helix repeat-containing protein [Geminicoccaceae bacterium]